MDLTDTMKNLVNKSLQSDLGHGSGYVTEKLYMLLQLYLQNKGWNPSVELLQCFTELKEASMLPSAAYLQMMAQRVALDSQGRLVLRDTGKIILPFEHFANAVMLKHMNGPQGMHLGLEATIRAVMDSYTIGREQFGMEKEFIIEVVQNCPNPACRYYKSQLEMSHRSHSHHSSYEKKEKKTVNVKPAIGSSSRDSEHRNSSSAFGSDFGLSHHHSSNPVDLTPTEKGSKGLSASAASRCVIVGCAVVSNAYSFVTITRAQLLSAVQQMVGAVSAAAAAGNKDALASLSLSSKSKHHDSMSAQDHKIADFLRANLESLEGLGLSSSNKDLLALHNGAWGSHDTETKRITSSSSEGMTSEPVCGVILLTVDVVTVGQEKIVRAFTEIMKNMARMKTCIRPAMCKPYGKQSESLQKTLMDTVQLVQSLRQVLPPPHIAVSSWKNEDKHSDPGRKLD